MGLLSYMLLNFFISTQCGTSTHTSIPNNLSLKYEFLPHWYTFPRAEAILNTNTSQTILLKYRYHNETHLPENSSERLSMQELNCTRLSWSLD